MVPSRHLSIRPSAIVLALAGSLSVLAAPPAIAGPAPKSARPVAGGYYVGTTATGKPASADVSRDAKQVSAAQFTLVCGGQQTRAGLQNMKIHRSHGKYKFSGSGTEALLFTSSGLSELGQVSVTGKFTSGHKVRGTFRVQSPTCGDSGNVTYALKLKTH